MAKAKKVKKNTEVKKQELPISNTYERNLDKVMTATGAVQTENKDVFSMLKIHEFPYSARTVEQYKKDLEKMNLSDLQRHAIEVAHIIPNITERHKLCDKLVREYLKKQAVYVSRYSSSEIQKPQEMSEEAKQSTLNILKRAL